MAIIKVGDKATAPSTRPSLLLDFANSKSLDSRINFSRSTTGTYYDGKTAIKGAENLYSDSTYFTGWGGGTVENEYTTAPDGTQTAARHIENTLLAYRDGSRTFPGKRGYVTLSTHFKKIGTGNRYPYIGVRRSFGNWAGVIADLDNGTINLVDSGIVEAVNGGIENLGEGWFRVWVTTYQNDEDYIRLHWGTTANPSGFSSALYMADYYTGDGTNGFYIWGTQVEERAYVTSYTHTNISQIITSNMPVLKTALINEPRFDHDPVTGESKGLLIEETRTNLFAYSEEMAQGAWNYYNYGNWRRAEHNTNVDIAPDGTLTADTYESTDTIMVLAQRVNCSPNTTYTVSAWIKATRLSTAHLYFITSHGDSNDTLIDYPTTWIGDRDDRLLQDPQWVRVSHTWTTPSNATSFEVGLTSGYDVPQNRSAILNKWLVWGLQLEEGNFASSYIPTKGSSQVTRSYDSVTLANVDWIKQYQGTVYVEVDDSNGSNPYLLGLGDDSQNRFWTYISNSNVVYSGSEVNNVAELGVNYQLPSEYTKAVAFSYKRDYFEASISGIDIGGDTSGHPPYVDTLYLGARGNNYYMLGGCMKKFAYYPDVMSQAELQAMTEE